MTQRSIKNANKRRGETIVLRPAAKEQMRETLDALIGTQSFQVDLHADMMADLGAAALGRHLEVHDRSALRRFGNGTGEPFVIIEGLPVQDPMPWTPQAFHDDASVEFTDCTLLGAMRLFRIEPIAFSYENFGKLMRNVAPVKTAEKSVSSHGSKMVLEWHTDNAYAFEGNANLGSPSPRFLCFIGLRNHDANGRPVATELITVDSIVEVATPRLLRAMQRKDFEIRPGQSNDRQSILNMPLLEFCPATNKPLLRFNANEGQTVGMKESARRTVREVGEVLESLANETIPILVEPGSILMFDNYRVLHRRSSFDAGELQTARWLRRCFASRNRDSGVYVDPIHRPCVWA